MTDLLRMDHINSLPQPFMARMVGGSEWPAETICVETGLMHLDVCGKLDCAHIADVAVFTDAEGEMHEPDTFYADYRPDSLEDWIA